MGTNTTRRLGAEVLRLYGEGRQEEIVPMVGEAYERLPARAAATLQPRIVEVIRTGNPRSFAEIATRLGVSRPTVSVAVARIRRNWTNQYGMKHEAWLTAAQVSNPKAKPSFVTFADWLRGVDPTEYQ